MRLGNAFALSLKRGDVVALIGELGTGKTHFITGACAGLGARGHIASPTFTIINEYMADGFSVVHIDLYRITSRAELAELGIEEYFNDRHICLIEWAERMIDSLPDEYVKVELTYGAEDNERLITVDQVQRKSKEAHGAVA
jgi:tRNA threonylcarbamoyladenosine biosynthesis protein TsaE